MDKQGKGEDFSTALVFSFPPLPFASVFFSLNESFIYNIFYL